MTSFLSLLYSTRKAASSFLSAIFLAAFRWEINARVFEFSNKCGFPLTHFFFQRREFILPQSAFFNLRNFKMRDGKDEALDFRTV